MGSVTDTMHNLWLKFSRQPMVMKIIAVNIAVFVLLRVAVIIALFAGNHLAEHYILQWVELPGELPVLFTRPWTLITYMFAQYDVMHILFNMLWLYWFGIVFSDITPSRRLLMLYIFGGLLGALFFIIACYTLPSFGYASHWLIGASAGVIAIVTAAAVLMPDLQFNLLFLGPVSLKWIAIVTIGIDLLGGFTGSNVGGNIAHIGGAVAGLIYAIPRRHGRNIFTPLENLLPRLKSAFSRPKRNDRRESATDVERDRRRLDAILEKIKTSGYSALTADERRQLFEISNREKKR